MNFTALIEHINNNKACPGFVAHRSCDHTGMIFISREVVRCLYVINVVVQYIDGLCHSQHTDITWERQAEREQVGIGTDIWLLGGSSRSESSTCLTRTCPPRHAAASL